MSWYTKNKSGFKIEFGDIYITAMAPLLITHGAKYSRMDQVKFVEDRLQKIWSDMVCLGNLRLA